MYVIITDNKECYWNTMEFIDGVYANIDEWRKHDFYPQNGMVGELVKITPRAYVVKISEGIYVPISKKGIREITYKEYSDHVNNNNGVDMNKSQLRSTEIMDSALSFMGYSWRHLPDMREHFKQDIIENIKKLTCDFEKNIYLPDLEKSCVIYATDMILEYKQDWGATLPPYVIDEISDQVIDVYRQFFSIQFQVDSVSRCKKGIKELVNNSDVRNIIDDYYHQVNMRYSWH